jgi:hypothetical protein
VVRPKDKDFQKRAISQTRTIAAKSNHKGRSVWEYRKIPQKFLHNPLTMGRGYGIIESSRERKERCKMMIFWTLTSCALLAWCITEAVKVGSPLSTFAYCSALINLVMLAKEVL